MNADYFSPDIQDFLYQLADCKVRYMIVGGEAVIYYGNPRLTGDIDFYYKNSSENVDRLYKVLSIFWSGDIPGAIDQEDLMKPGYVIQFGTPPNRIDLMNEIEGVNFYEAWEERNIVKISIDNRQVPVNYIGLKHLILNKELTGRGKDLEDLNYLRSVKENNN